MGGFRDPSEDSPEVLESRGRAESLKADLERARAVFDPFWESKILRSLGHPIGQGVAD